MNDMNFQETEMTEHINTDNWGGPDIPDVLDMVKVDNDALAAALRLAFSQGVNALIGDLSIQVDHEGINIIDINYEDFAVIPLKDLGDCAIVNLKDYLVVGED